jgi:hypothetical protein
VKLDSLGDATPDAAVTAPPSATPVPAAAPTQPAQAGKK